MEKKVIYTADPARQQASIAMYEAQDIDVAVMDSLIDLNFLSFMEYSGGIEDLKFARVDADAEAFSDTSAQAASDEQQKAMQDLFRDATHQNELQVKLGALKDADLPAMLTQDEQGRRFNDMSRIYGQDFKMPETSTLLLNQNNAVVKHLMNGADDTESKEMIASQIYDLARLSTRPLEKDEITDFLKRSRKLLEMLCR